MKKGRLFAVIAASIFICNTSVNADYRDSLQSIAQYIMPTRLCGSVAALSFLVSAGYFFKGKAMIKEHEERKQLLKRSLYEVNALTSAKNIETLKEANEAARTIGAQPESPNFLPIFFCFKDKHIYNAFTKLSLVKKNNVVLLEFSNPAQLYHHGQRSTWQAVKDVCTQLEGSDKVILKGIEPLRVNDTDFVDKTLDNETQKLNQNNKIVKRSFGVGAVAALASACFYLKEASF